MRISKERGFTIIEVLVTLAIIGILMFVVASLPSIGAKWFQRSRAREQANLQARACMETIERTLSDGKFSTLITTNTATTPSMQAGQAQFNAVDGTAYTIAWSTAPANSVHILRTPLGGASAVDTVLASNVTMLSFMYDPNNPGMVSVGFRMTVPLDSTGSSDSFYTILLPSQLVRMIGS